MINVPISQSIRFRPINSDPFNFDNTFGCARRFTQYVAEDELKIQVVTPDDNETLSYLELVHTATRVNIEDVSTSIIGQYKYDTYTIDFSAYPNEVCYLEAFVEVPPAAKMLSFRSEPFTVLNQPDFFKLNWFNTENNFLLDYSAGLVNELWIEGKKQLLPYGGSSSIYSNQGEKVKLKGITSRVFQFQCDVPDYIADQINLAIEHDRFYINDIEFTVEKKPQLAQLGTSNMCQLSMEVEQRTIIGLNSHDAG